MSDCTCHLCGEAMEPDVLLMQGDTCELCYLLHVIPTDLVRRLDDGFGALQLVASAAIAELHKLGADELQPPQPIAEEA